MVNKVCFFLSLFGLVTGVLFCQVDLAEVQRKEKERRKKMPKSSVKLTDETVKDLKVQSSKYGYTQLQENEKSQGDEKVGNEGDAAQSQDGAETDSAASSNKDQTYWLSEKRRLDEMIAEVSKDLAGLQIKIDAAFTIYVGESRPFEKDAKAQEIEELKATQAEKKEELTRLEQELRDFYNRARKEGVPPGWLRE